MSNGSYPAQQLNYLGNALREGMLDIGNLELARERQAYELGDPRTLVAREKAQIERDELTRMDNTPASTEYLMGTSMDDPVAMEFFGTHIVPELEKHGVAIKFRPGGKGAYYVSKSTGKILTEGDFYRRRNLTRAIFAGKIHPRAALETLEAKAAPALRGKIKQQIDEFDKNPAPFFDKNIAYLQSLRTKVYDPTMVDSYIEMTKAQKAEALAKLKATKKDEGPKVGDRRGPYQRGDQIYYQEWNGTKWVDVKGGPKWQEKETAGAGKSTKEPKFDWKAYDALYAELFSPTLDKESGQVLQPPLADRPISAAQFNALKIRAEKLGCQLLGQPSPDGTGMVVTNLITPQDYSMEAGGTVSPGYGASKKPRKRFPGETPEQYIKSVYGP